MQRIMKKEINFSNLQRIGEIASESKIYHDNQYVYKIFKKMSKDELELKHLKVERLQHVSVQNILKPQMAIYNKNILGNEQFIGYIREYKKGDVLFNYFFKSEDISTFLQIIKEISLTLRSLHDDHIIVGDLQFDNILIDENLKHYFLDIDSCIIDRLPTVTYPVILHYYAQNRNISRHLNQILSEKTDRLCLMMSCISLLFEYIPPDYISLYDCDEKAEQIKTLKNMRDLFVKITDKSTFLPEVPYIDELVSEEDIGKRIILK